jgi:ADP-ribose pyrophosphatase YjhB (NUDIX family)
MNTNIKTTETDKRVFVAILTKKGRVLVCKRAQGTNNPGQWGLPGGHIDEGETVDEAAERELREEINLTIDLKQMNVVRLIADKKRTLIILQRSQVTLSDMRPNPEEVESFVWMGYEDISALKPEMMHKSLVRFVDLVKPEHGASIQNLLL